MLHCCACVCVLFIYLFYLFMCVYACLQIDGLTLVAVLYLPLFSFTSHYLHCYHHPRKSEFSSVISKVFNHQSQTPSAINLQLLHSIPPSLFTSQHLPWPPHHHDDLLTTAADCSLWAGVEKGRVSQGIFRYLSTSVVLSFVFECLALPFRVLGDSKRMW